MGEEALKLLHKAVIVQGVDSVGDDINLDPATSASGRRVYAYEDFVAFDLEIERLEALFLEGVRFHPFEHCGDASNRRLAPWADKLNVGMDHLYQRLDIAAIERFVESPQGGDHLLLQTSPAQSSRLEATSATPEEGNRTPDTRIMAIPAPDFRLSLLVVSPPPDQADLGSTSPVESSRFRLRLLPLCCHRGAYSIPGRRQAIPTARVSMWS